MISKHLFIRNSALVAYIAMIFTNALANILPINNLTTGAVSDSYPNLFAPAGVTFSIWGLIYLLLGAYLVFQFTTRKNAKIQSLLEKINKYFILSSLVNAVWIFTWHYKLIWLSVLFMVLLLYSLIKIADCIGRETMTKREKYFIKVPFGVYFGWITIATIANITVFLVSIGWRGFGITDSIWMIIVLIVGYLISSWRMLKDKSIAYGLVPVWAYLGILLKHTSSTGFNSQYPLIINAVSILLVALLITNGYLVVKKRAL